MKRKHLDIIDPIHDFVRAYGVEIKIIDNSIFQRLRRIRQLSGAYLTYPGAQHTRFEHSLGVMHITGQAAQALEEKGIINSDDIENLRLAALLHDIGHGPFSHLFEEVAQRKKKSSHEKFDNKRITQSLDVYHKKLALEKSALYSFESMMHSRYQMFKAVYFHKTVRSAEVMLLESMRLAYEELGLSSMSLDDYIELTDDYMLAKLVSLPTHTSDLKRAQKIATD